jgi:hypothetical protein
MIYRLGDSFLIFMMFLWLTFIVGPWTFGVAVFAVAGLLNWLHARRA